MSQSHSVAELVDDLGGDAADEPWLNVIGFCLGVEPKPRDNAAAAAKVEDVKDAGEGGHE